MHIHLFRINIPIDQSEFHSDLRGNPAFVASLCITSNCSNIQLTVMKSSPGREAIQLLSSSPLRLHDTIAMLLISKAVKSRKIIYSGLYKSSSVITVCSVHWITQPTKYWTIFGNEKMKNTFTQALELDIKIWVPMLIHTLRWSSLPNYSTTVVFSRVGFEISMTCYLP